MTEEKIFEIYNELKDNCIGVYLAGSRTLSYIKEANDYDYVFLYDTEEHMLNAKNKYLQTFDLRQIQRNEHIDIIFRYENISIYDAGGFSTEAKTIIGKPIEKAEIFGILDKKDFFKNKCIEKYNRLLLEMERYPEIRYNLYTFKLGYYIYRIIAVIKNNSYELTSEQIEEINILHNRQTTIEERKPIIDKLIEEIKLWQI